MEGIAGNAVGASLQPGIEHFEIVQRKHSADGAKYADLVVGDDDQTRGGLVRVEELDGRACR